MSDILDAYVKLAIWHREHFNRLRVKECTGSCGRRGAGIACNVANHTKNLYSMVPIGVHQHESKDKKTQL